MSFTEIKPSELRIRGISGINGDVYVTIFGGKLVCFSGNAADCVDGVKITENNIGCLPMGLVSEKEAMNILERMREINSAATSFECSANTNCFNWD